ncbi:MAG: GYD domain-containing protein [Dehalococcoidia bacterium]|nr:GYD domain-containing protein [Dehalococcoidia bacterium]
MLFVSLLLPKGKGKEAVDYLKKLKAPQGIKVHDVYVTFGRYDGVILFEAPDAKTALNFVMETGFATDYTIETLTAVPAKEL